MLVSVYFTANNSYYRCTRSCTMPHRGLSNHCGAMTIYTRTLATSSASQVLIDTWVGKGNLDSCYVRNQN